jgi:hypothetical protein
MTVKIPNSYVTDNLALFDEFPYQLLTVWVITGPTTGVGWT